MSLCLSEIAVDFRFSAMYFVNVSLSSLLLFYQKLIKHVLIRSSWCRTLQWQCNEKLDKTVHLSTLSRCSALCLAQRAIQRDIDTGQSGTSWIQSTNSLGKHRAVKSFTLIRWLWTMTSIYTDYLVCELLIRSVLSTQRVWDALKIWRRVSKKHFFHSHNDGKNV